MPKVKPNPDELVVELVAALKREQVLREAVVEVIGVLKCHPEKEGGDNELSAADQNIMDLCDDALENAPYSLDEWMCSLVNDSSEDGGSMYGTDMFGRILKGEVKSFDADGFTLLWRPADDIVDWTEESCPN